MFVWKGHIVVCALSRGVHSVVAVVVVVGVV